MVFKIVLVFFCYHIETPLFFRNMIWNKKSSWRSKCGRAPPDYWPPVSTRPRHWRRLKLYSLPRRGCPHTWLNSRGEKRLSRSPDLYRKSRKLWVEKRLTYDNNINEYLHVLFSYIVSINLHDLTQT